MKCANPECLKEFKSYLGIQKYCSRKCCDRRKVKPLKCKNCGELFYPVIGLGLKVCCSLNCYRQYRRNQVISIKRKRNKTKRVKEYNYNNKLKCINDLSIGYVNDKLRRDGFEFITNELRERKILLLKIKRRIKQIKNETNG